MGSGPLMEKWTNYVENLEENISKRIYFTGTVKKVEHYLNCCKIGVLCSTLKYKEGLSNSLLEYMAVGLVSIATNIGGTKEIIKNKVNGYFINPGDYNALIDIVTELKINPELRFKISKTAREIVEKKFNTDNINKLVNIYNLI